MRVGGWVRRRAAADANSAPTPASGWPCLSSRPRGGAALNRVRALGRSRTPGAGDARARARWATRSLTAACQTATIERDGQPRPPDGARLDVPAPRGPLDRAHARRLGDGLRGRRRRRRRSSSTTSLGRLHLVPRYRQRLAYVPLGQGRPVWADDPHFNPLYHIRHTALPQAGRRRGAQAPRRAALLPAPGPLQAAVGDLARAEHGRRTLRADRQDPPRARRRDLGRGHHDRAVRHRAASRSPTPRPPTPWTRQAAARAGEAARRGAASSARRCPAEMVRGARALLRAPRRAARAGQATASRASARRRSPASTRRRRRARSTSRSARTAATRSSTPTSTSFKAIKDSLGGTLNDVVLASVSLALGRYLRRAGHRHRRARAEGDGAGVGARRRRSAARSATRSPRCGRRCRSACENPAECLQQIAARDGGPEEVRPGGRRAGADQPRRLRAADDPQPGRAPAGAPAVLQPRRHERARPAVPAVPARPRACACSTRSCRSPSARRSASR